MKEIILTIFAVIGIMTALSVCGAIITSIISSIISNKKHKPSSESDQSIESLTIEATNDKQCVDEALSDCDNLINFIKTYEKENKLSKDVEIIDEAVHMYRLLMSFDDLDSQIDFNKYMEKYNYNHSLVKTYSTKELLMIQTFALKFYEYMFPNDVKPYSRGRNGICQIQFIHDETVNIYGLKIEYVYGTTSVTYNYPILDGYYFGCMVGSQILITDLLDMINEMERILDIDKLSSSAVINHIKGIFAKMRNTLNAKKFPQFKE